MRVAGIPDDWINLIDTFVPDILDVVITTWEEMPSPAPDAEEDPTTEALCRSLRQHPRRCDLPFQIHIQLVELEPAAGADLGRMDIVFTPFLPCERIYFCLECKRLNVWTGGQVRPYTSEYVTNGMMRFAQGQYSSVVRHGGMLGYVLDGNVADALANVERNIRNQHVDLGMDPPGAVLVSSIRPSDERVRETHHRRSHDPSLFRIHHLFVAGAQGNRTSVTKKSRPKRRS